MEQEQSPEVGQNKWNSVWPILLTVVITAGIVGGGVYWWQSSKIVPENEITEVVESQSAQIDTKQVATQEKDEVVTAPAKLVNTAINGNTVEQSYNFRHGEREGFTSLSRGNIIYMAKKAMAKLYENEESITSFYTPEHPTNSDIIFISSSGDTSGEWPDFKSTNKIYSYNIKTGEIVQLYEEHEDRLLRTMGMDGSKLVLMYDIIDNSPGPCFSIWADWESFGYLELADINSGLRPYTVPNYQVEISKAEQEKCIEEMGF